MTRRFAIATLSFFLIEVVHCAVDPLLRPRQGETCTGNITAVSCPTEDLAFYPLAESLSGPSYETFLHLTCYYPFVSNCHYNLVNLFSSQRDRTYKASFWQTTGVLVRDINEGHCVSKAEPCGSDCTSAYRWQCPDADDTMTPLDIASVHVPEDILFCSYPTPIQPYIPVYFCNYHLVGLCL